MKYYKHIDGLRALAVLSVIFFHLDIHYIKSGFLGVDIFFVISGFLITNIIIRDLENDSFALKNFYLRRMRRIIPALIFVLIFSTIFAWLILFPQDLKSYSKTLLSVLGSFSNLYFFKTFNFGYFSTDATVIPLLHTWSLGIEEQFYLFWPLFLIFIYNINISWKDKQALSSFNKCIIMSIILFIFSLLCFKYFSYFQIYNYFNHEKFYYFPLTRAFELLFGCILAIYLKRYKPVNNRFVLEVVSIFSIILMLYPILFKVVHYPSNWTVIACVGAMLYIYAGFNENYSTIVNRVLSTKPIIFIGLISYSLYLWHWPIIAYLNYLSIEKTYIVKIIVLILSGILASLTYFMIEKPFRLKIKMSFAKTLILLWIIPIIFASCFALVSNYFKDFGFNKANKDFEFNTQRAGSFDPFICDPISKNLEVDKSQIKLCKPFGDTKKNNIDIVLYGDSHARQLSGIIDVWAKKSNLKAIEFTSTKRLTLYSKKSGEIIDSISKILHPKYIVFGGLWQVFTPDRENSLRYLSNAIKKTIDHHITPVLFLDTAPLLNVKVNCGFNRFKLITPTCRIPENQVTNLQKQSSKIIQKIINKFPEIIVIDIKNITCDKLYCYNKINNFPIYYNNLQFQDKYLGTYDNSHLNFMGSKLIGQEYLKKYSNPFK